MKWFLLFLIFVFFSEAIDLAVARYFFHEGHFSGNLFFHYLYRFGERPAQITAGAGLILYLFKGSRTGLYLFLTLAIGAFLINEVALKNQWGRPRPRQVIEFGGKQPFRPFYQPQFTHQTEQQRSFPCGHCTAGYYFLALYFLGKRKQNPPLMIGGLLLAVLFGSALGLARMAQGGHFFSDVVFSFLVMGVTAWWLDKYIYERTYKAAS